MTREYIFEILWADRDEDGEPFFDDAGPEDEMRQQVERLGVPWWRSEAFAARMMARAR